MSFSFDPTLINPIDRIRLALGDTVSPGLLPDETYLSLLAIYATEQQTIIYGARSLAAYYATQPTQLSSDGSSITWGQRIQQWNAIAAGTYNRNPSGYTSFSTTPRRVDGYSAANTSEY